MYLILEYLTVIGVVLLLGVMAFGAVAAFVLVEEGWRVVSDWTQQLFSNTAHGVGGWLGFHAPAHASAQDTGRSH